MKTGKDPIETQKSRKQSASVPPVQAEGPSPAESEKHHVHHSYIWLGSFRTFLSILFVLAVSAASSLVGVFIDIASGAHPGEIANLLLIGAIVAIGIFAILAFVVGLHYLSYKHLYFVISSSEFSLYKGIISKKRVHVPYHRVQSVDQRASLLQRIFGVCNVLIDTAGGSSNKAIMVPYLTKQQAEWLRMELFARKRRERAAAAGWVVAEGQGAAGASHAPQEGNVLDFGARAWDEIGGVFAGQELDTGKVTYEYGLSNKELLLTGISNNTAFMLVFFALVGLVAQVAGFLVGFFPKQGDHMIESALAQATGSAAVSFFAMIAGCVALAMLVVWVLTGLGACINYGGFRARRRDSRIETEHGLLQHVFQGVDVDRVQAVIVRQSFIRRLLGCCELSLAKIDADTAEDQGMKGKTVSRGVVVHPFVKVDRVPEILAGILPEYQDAPVEVRPVAPVALRRMICRHCVWQGAGFWMAVVVSIALVALKAMFGVFVANGLSAVYASVVMRDLVVVAALLYFVAVLIFVLDAIDSVLWFRESGFAVNARFMRLVKSGFTKDIYIIPRQKIQYGKVRTNPFQRMAHVASLHVRTAAGVGGTTVRLLDVAEADATSWLKWLEPKGKLQ